MSCHIFKSGKNSGYLWKIPYVSPAVVFALEDAEESSTGGKLREDHSYH